jgi:REP element-mobilizing transposase RayT
MPDHLHLLVAGTTPAADAREFIRRFKQRSSFSWKHQGGATLWQRSYYDRVLRRDEDVISVARYILANPVRAGLVGDAAQYALSGSFTVSFPDLLASISR